MWWPFKKQPVKEQPIREKIQDIAISLKEQPDQWWTERSFYQHRTYASVKVCHEGELFISDTEIKLNPSEKQLLCKATKMCKIAKELERKRCDTEKQQKAVQLLESLKLD